MSEERTGRDAIGAVTEAKGLGSQAVVKRRGKKKAAHTVVNRNFVGGPFVSQ